MYFKNHSLVGALSRTLYLRIVPIDLPKQWLMFNAYPACFITKNGMRGFNSLFRNPKHLL
jgi:hypothetical protein